MTYVANAARMEATDENAGARARARLSAANINPATGLATDYLNHFNEAIMLLELSSSCPECIDDLLAWRPLSYREHFEASSLKGRDLMIAAYEDADPAARAALDTLADGMTSVLEAARAAMCADISSDGNASLAHDAAAWLRQRVAHAGAVINGELDGESPETPQSVVDRLLNR